MAMLAPPLPRFKPGSNPNPVAQAMVDPAQAQPQQPPAAFVWGENGEQLSPEDVARKRQIAQAMMQEGSSYAPVQHWTQGLARVAEALAGGLEERRANEADAANKKGARDQMAAYMAEVGDPTIDAKVHREHGVSLMDNPYLGEGGRAVVGQDFKAPSERWTTEDVNKDGIPDRQINSITGEVKAVAEPALTFDQRRLLAREGAARSTTTINTGGEKAFEQELGKGQAKTFTDMATDGVNAKGDMASIGELKTQLGRLPGGLAGGLQGLAASWGIPIGKNADAAQAATAIISRLVPVQRTPGSGQMSDRDVLLFKDSLPKLINSPEGNALILDTMQAMARFKMDQAQIASRVMSGEIDRKAGMKAIADLPDPLETFRAGGTAASKVDHSKAADILKRQGYIK